MSKSTFTSKQEKYAQPHFTVSLMSIPNGDEERPLLEDEENIVQPATPGRNYLTWKIVGSLSALVLLAVGGAAYFGARTSKPEQPTRDAERFWNGTHEFKRTVILVSIDGLRLVIRRSYSARILISLTARVTSTAA